MSKLKQKKYIASILIMVIVLGIIGLFSYGKVDKYKGQIKVGKVKLLGSVIDTGLVTSKGTEEVKYNLTYTLDPVEGLEKRDVEIKGKLNSPYARFKEIRKSNITSTLNEDGTEITINASDIRLGEEQSLEIKIQVLNAPNNENIIPEISIKEKTGEETRVSGSPIKVETNSVEGIVLDENNLPVSNIELSISKNGKEVRRTYTDINGKYVFSDLEEGSYTIKVEEDIYELVSGTETSESNPNNKIKVKQVDKYNVETKKYIENLDLVVNGKKEHYTYKDAEKVIQTVKNAKRISGKIEYKIVIRNKSDKQVEIDELEDTPGEGLEFKESENDGWKNKDGKIVYELMEGVSLRGKEKREVKLVLSINDTNEIKTYINKLTSKGEIKEKVVFVIDNKIKRKIEVTEGTVIKRPHFDIEDLDGWYTDNNYTNKYKFTNRVNKDLILYARTNEEKPKYQVRYIDKNEVIKTEEVEEGERTTAPSNPSKRGYTFNCWKNKNSCFNFDTPIEEDVDLISDYQVITYDITYNLRGGTVTGNPDSYTVETNPFTLNNPEKEGYTFIGWTGSNGSTPSLSVSLPDETLEDKEYTANFQINRYQLTIDPKGGEYSGDLLLEGDYGSIITISEPTKEGYTFTGWTLTGSGTYNNGIYTFGDGNGKLEANYEVINYDIVYKEITDAERTQLNNPTSYNIETNEFTLNNPANRLNEDNEGEVFVGWKEKNSDTPSMNITLPDRNNLGKKEYTAIWQERQPDKWNITYILNGGTVSGNPTEYKRSQLPITLNNPTKTGYTFKGWTGSNGDTPGNVTIARGTEGDLNYTANYEVNNYTISYDYTSCNLTPEEITALNNRGSYTIEDNNFNLNNPNKYGYVFEGWTGTDLETKTVNVTVDTSKIKNLSYKANCVLDKYDVEFYNMKSNGEYELSTTVSDIEYNSSIPSNKIPTVSLRGYTFKYWSLDKTNEFNFNTPITENTKLYAVYQKDTYNITYELDGGTVSGNPDTYSVDTPEFTLNEPSKEGYEFTGWTGSCGDSPLKVVTLPEEELGPKNYVANYKINKYTVTYMNGESKVDDEEVEYNKKATGDVETPTKAHNIFKGWTLNNELYDFDTPVTSDITLYASWEEVEAPTITHTPTTWVRDKVLVTVTSDHTDYTYMYKIGNGTYQSYSEPFEVTENTTIYAYSVKDEINSIEESHEINNIDKINPSINGLEEVGKTPTSVTLNIKGQDLESGLTYIKVYLGSDEVFSTEEYPGNDNDEKEVEVTIGNLEQLTTYTFTIEVIDKVGNISSEEIEVTTPEKHYVARTLDEDGVEIKKYETLKEAIESSECVNICKIEMLDNVEETNSILDGQDIKLDLNGFTITGLQDKAFENNGIFKIVDYNEDEIGKVTSPGTAIVNTGKLIIGENEEPLEVSKTEPVIEGLVTGINSPGELHFYDGKIMGGSTTGALKGSAPITPYSYNASVETSGDKEIATLEIIADAEARINSVYYTKVQEAVEASKNGSYTYSDEPTDILKQSKVTSDYGFIYDENTGTLKSNNQGISSTTATSYIYIDTRGEANDKILTVDTSISSQGGVDIGYVTVTNNKAVPTYDQSSGRLIYISGTSVDNFNYILEKGKEYYLHFGYRKDGGTNSGEDTFTINSIKLADYSKQGANDLTNYLVSDSQYHFKKMQDGSYMSNNDDIEGSTAHSYLKIDLTDVDEEKLLYVDTKFNTRTNYDSDYMFITLNNSSDRPAYNDTEGRLYYASRNQARQLYEIHLIPNQVNYLHFGNYSALNRSDVVDNLTIYSIRYEDEIIQEHLNSDITRNGTFYMEETNVEPGVWKDTSGNDRDAKIENAVWNSNGDGLVLSSSKLTISNSGITINNEETVDVVLSSTSASSFSPIYFGTSGEKIAISLNSNGFISISANDTYDRTYNTPSDFYDGTVKRLTAVYNNGEYKMYYNGTELTLNTRYTNRYTGDSNNYIGGSGYSYFNGTIYSIKVYDKEFTETDILNNTEYNDNLLLKLDGSNHEKILENSAFINNNRGKFNSVASSYLTFDLTDLPSKNIYINAEISSNQGNDIGYITVNNSTAVPAYNTESGRYVYISGEVEAKDYKIPLTGGRVNYVHMSYRKAGVNAGKDTFKINYIKYYADSAETIPVYIFSNQTDKKIERTISLNSNPDTVQIIRNITMTNPLEIVETRDVVLDLNGYTLTTSKDDYVVDNKGSLKIIDSDYDGQVDRAREKYEREQAEYDRQYEEVVAQNEEKYRQALEEYEHQYERLQEYMNSDEFDTSLYPKTGDEYTLEDAENYYSKFVSNFDYTGDVQEFIAPISSGYTFEAWGSSGGKALCNGSVCGTPGKGGYSKGTIWLNKGDKVYIYVGSKGTDGTYEQNAPASFNGGGLGTWDNSDNEAAGAGGGATDIRLTPGNWYNNESLASRIMVAGGGGGASWSSYSAGFGGGLAGGNNSAGGALGATQTTGYQFGIGKNGEGTGDGDGVAGGGGGYYGGTSYSSSAGENGSGGSGYVSGHVGAVAINSPTNISPRPGCEDGTTDITCSYHHSGKIFADTQMISGNQEMPTHDNTTTMVGNEGNGFVRITTSNIEPTKDVATRKYAKLDTDQTLNGNILSTTNNTVLNEAGAYLDFEQGIINIDKEGSYGAINNRGTLTMGDNAFIYGKKGSNRGIINESTGDIIEGTGNIIMSGSSNIGILNDSHVDEEIKGYNLSVSNSNSTNFYNRSTIPVTVNGMKTGGAGVDIHQNTNIDLTVKNSTLGSTSNESYYSNETSVVSNVTFDNCDIKNRIYNRRNSARTILIKDSTLSGTRGNIYNYGGKVTVNNSELTNTATNYNYSTTEFNDCVISVTVPNTWGYAIRNGDIDNKIAQLYVNNTVINTNVYALQNDAGTATFDGSIINGPGLLIYNGTYSYSRKAAHVVLKDTTINKTGSEDTSVVYNYEGTITIDGGRITTASDNSTAVYNEASSTNVLVIKGNFSNSSNFTRCVNNQNIFTLGEDDGVVSKTYPEINGTNSAIYTADNKTFNYYDGKVTGLLDKALDSPINDIASLHDTFVTKGESLEEVILKTKEEAETDQDYVAQIGSTKYVTLQSAFDAVPDDNTETEVLLLKDIETDAHVVLDTNKNVVLNYDGHTIKTYNIETYLTNNGTLKMIDANDTVNNKSYSNYLITNNGTINYNSVKSMPIRTKNIINNNENATFNMNGGEIYSYQSGLITNNGLFNMSGGKIYTTRTDAYNSGTYNLIINETTGEMNISGGAIRHIGNGSAIVNKNELDITDITLDLLGCSGYRVRYTTYFITATAGSETNITGGTFGQTNPDGIFISNAGTAYIENIISNLYGSAINTGTITLKNVQMNNLKNIGGVDRSPTMYTYNSGTMLIQGGSYKGSTNNAGFICEGTNSLTIDGAEISIYSWKNSLMKFSNNSTVIINNSSVRNISENIYNWGPVVELNNNSSLSSTNTQFYGSVKYPIYGNADGIYHNSTNEVTLTNVDVTSNKQAITRVNTGNLNIISGNYQSTSNEALYNSATGTITIGEKGGVPSKTSPSFNGNNYGLNNTNQEAIINFYDGIFSGTTAIQGKINEIEPGYEIILETDDKEHKFLDKLPIVKNTRTNGEFYTIQEALDDENFQNNDTLEVLREATIMPDALTINVSAGKIATIDLKGYKITQNNEKFIENNGTLSIKSSEDGGMIETNSSNIFENNGKLNIISGLYTTKTTDYVLVNNENAVTNITDGEINSYQTHVIYNDGEMNMTGGLVRATRTSNDKAGSYNLIENDEHGELNITGGEITFVGSGNTINNKNAVSVSGVKVDLYGYYAYNDNHSFTRFINNVTETSTALINGGSYGVEQNKGILIVNNGTAIVINTTTHFGGSIINYGTLDCINSNINMTYYAGGYNGAKNQPYTYNTGNMRVIGTKIIGKSNNTFVINEGSGRLDFIKSYIELYDAYWYNNEAKTIRSSGNSTINLEYTDVKTTATYASAGLYLNGNSSATLTGGVTDGDISSYLTPEELALLDSTNISLDTEFKGSITMSPTNERSDTYGIHSENSGNVSIDNFKVNTYRNAIHKTGSAQMDIISGEFISSDNNGIYNTGSGNISIGELGGTVSKTNPKITGKSYGFYNSSTTSEVNFYDGIITGNTAIYGKITDVEPTYEIIQTHNEDDTYSKYLDQIPLVKNTRTDEEFNTIQDAISNPGFTNGDTLEVLRELTTLPSYTTITIPSGTDVVIDMKGYKFNQNNEKLFINNGTLKMTDSAETPGNIQTFSGTIIENNGTMIVEKVKLYTETSISKLVINNENATITFNNINLLSPNYQLIQNAGTMNINGGNYKKTNSGTSGSSSETSIINTSTGTLNISSGNFENRGDGTVGIYNYNVLNITGGTFTEKGGGTGDYRYISNCLYNTSTGTITIDGATFNETHNKGRFLINYGSGTIDNSSINMKTLFNTYSGTLSFSNTNIVSNSSGNANLYNSSVVNITGGTISSTYDYFIYPFNTSTLNISNVTYTTNQYGLFRAEDNSVANVIGGTYTNTRSGNGDTGMFQFYENSTGTITNATTNAGYSYSIYAYGNSQILIQGGTLNSTVSSVVSSGNNVTNIISGELISTTTAAVYIAGTSKVTVGEKGGVPSTTSPVLYGKTYGINHSNNTSNFNFYDGIIKGETGSISGIINNVEDGYKEKRDNVTDPDTGVTTIDSTLTVVGDTERIAMVGTVNFLSLQSAVNYASNNNIPDIQMFKSVTLDADLVKPTGGVNVIIHLNGNTITQGSYTIDPGITLDSGTAPGASVARFLANITGEEINPRNIVVYELEDGSKLESNKTYKLYKEIGGELKIVKVKENEIGDYDLGYDKEILRTTRSRIYINGIGEGTYKLVGSDSKEITFTIYHDGVSSNIRENNNINGSRVSTAVATLILSLQTGMVRNPYILLIMILIVFTLGFIAYQKQKREE